ncbi:MAG: patatin-like phospholipase family protein [Egibacteraceae bacterium]
MKIAVVLAAGGARGAYQAGALDVLLPVLEARGERPSLFVGASVGALNAVGLAASAHRSAAEQADDLLWRWERATKPNVLRPLWQQLPLVALRYGAETLAIHVLRLQGLLGTEPLAKSLRRLIDWQQFHRNVADGAVSAVAAMATVVRSGRVVAFVEAAPGTVRPPPSATIDYVAAQLDVPHVRASAAIPMLFPAIRIDEPRTAAGWYVDGSTRLHAPLKPALDLGAERLVVLGTTGLAPRAPAPQDADLDNVDLGDGAVTLLNAMLEDCLRRDVRQLGEVNSFFADEQQEASASRRYRAALGKPAYRRVPFMVVAPPDPDEISRLAMDVYHANYHNLRGLLDPDFQLMHRLLGSDSPLQGELLSFLLFDADFIAELVRLGRRDARRWLREHPGDPWQVEPLQPLLPESGPNRTDGPS